MGHVALITRALTLAATVAAGAFAPRVAHAASDARWV